MSTYIHLKLSTVHILIIKWHNPILASTQGTGMAPVFLIV